MSGVDIDSEILLIEKAGKKLELPLNTVCRAMIIYHHFKRCIDEVFYDAGMTAAAAIGLAIKVDEEPFTTENILIVFFNMLHPEREMPKLISPDFKNFVNALVQRQYIMSRLLQFSLKYELAHQYLVNFMRSLHKKKEFADKWNVFSPIVFKVVSTAYLTRRCLEYDANMIAVVCIKIACDYCFIPMDNDWFHMMIPRNNPKLSRAINDILTVCNATIEKSEELTHMADKKWTTLSHNGPRLPFPYERVPDYVKFYYDGEPMTLSDLTEEYAGLYGQILATKRASNESFNSNFFTDWRKIMTPEERNKITDFSKCNFTDFFCYYRHCPPKTKQQRKFEEELRRRETFQKHGRCIIDGCERGIFNYNLSRNGIYTGFRMPSKRGKLRRAIQAEDVVINIGKEAEVPKPPPGHHWKEVRHDNTVSWLFSWTDPIYGTTEYATPRLPNLCANVKIDWDRYETARKLKTHISRIRKDIARDLDSTDIVLRQRAVALYLIDKLAFKAGDEECEFRMRDIGCCVLQVRHVQLHDLMDGEKHVVHFDFRTEFNHYVNYVSLDESVFVNLKLFLRDKQPDEYVFDMITTADINKYLSEIMPGLTTTIFHTYNASTIFQEQLEVLTKDDMSIPVKAFNWRMAVQKVASFLNYHSELPFHDQDASSLSTFHQDIKTKIELTEQKIEKCKGMIEKLQLREIENGLSDTKKLKKKKSWLTHLYRDLDVLHVKAFEGKDETTPSDDVLSRSIYLDPRITIAWSLKNGVSLKRIYGKGIVNLLSTTISVTDADFKF